MATDLPGTLASVASLGYTYVEFAGYYHRGPADIRRLLKQSGLEAPSVHVPPHALLDNPKPHWNQQLVAWQDCRNY